MVQGSVFFLVWCLFPALISRLTGVGSNGSSNIDNQISWFSSRSPCWKKLINPDLIFNFHHYQSVVLEPTLYLCLFVILIATKQPRLRSRTNWFIYLDRYWWLAYYYYIRTLRWDNSWLSVPAIFQSLVLWFYQDLMVNDVRILSLDHTIYFTRVSGINF